MDRLASMAAFVRAAELGSFAAAADALALSPQMIAKHVTSLEARLGTRLLARTTRRQSLTEIGRVYLERCRHVLAEADAADLVASDATAVPRGLLRVSAPVTFGTHRLMPFATRFLAAHPEVELDLVLADRLVDLVEEQFEAVFRIGPLDDSSLLARRLAPFRMLACASPAYLAARGVPQHVADLAAHSCLAYAYGNRRLRDQWQFTRDGRTEEVRVRSPLRLNDAGGMLVAALDGFGIVLIAEDLARAPLAAGRLVRVLPEHEPPTRAMHLLSLADRRRTPKLARFIEAASAEFARHPAT